MDQIEGRDSRFSGAYHGDAHTTIALQKITKARLDNSRAPGQCYDGFISELVDYWERYRIGGSLCDPGKPVSDIKR
jgi:hypothetical protein